jgi:hypothetical protein
VLHFPALFLKSFRISLSHYFLTQKYSANIRAYR